MHTLFAQTHRAGVVPNDCARERPKEGTSAHTHGRHFPSKTAMTEVHDVCEVKFPRATRINFHCPTTSSLWRSDSSLSFAGKHCTERETHALAQCEREREVPLRPLPHHLSKPSREKKLQVLPSLMEEPKLNHAHQ